MRGDGPAYPHRFFSRRLVVNDKIPGETVADSPPDRRAGPNKWWQWVLLYPSLLIALLGAVPSVREIERSFRLDVPFGQGSEAEKQLKLWQINFECLNRSPSFKPIINDKDIEISSIVCATGDVLIVGKPPDKPRQMKWVAWSEVVPQQGARTAASPFSVLQVAATSRDRADPGLKPKQGTIDQGANEQTQTVVCQRWIDKTRLLQRIKVADGCFDQTVDAPRGLVKKRRPTTCETPC
jgi:hypothetical protein